jgi:hypothetical protein
MKSKVMEEYVENMEEGESFSSSQSLNLKGHAFINLESVEGL